MSAARKAQTEPLGESTMTPERETLAAAIAAQAQHAADLAGARAGLRKLDGKSLEVSQAFHAAKETLAAAQEAAVAYAADTAAGKTPPAPISLRDARAAAADAEDDYAASKRAHETLLHSMRGLEETEHSGWKKLAVITAARAVLKSELDVQPLFAEIRALQDQLVQKRLVLCFLRGEYVVSSEDNPDKDWYLPTTQCQWPDILPMQWRRNPAPDWRSAFEALCEDATIELPAL